MPGGVANDTARRMRFDATLRALREAMVHQHPAATLPDDDIDAVIERARTSDKNYLWM